MRWHSGISRNLRAPRIFTAILLAAGMLGFGPQAIAQIDLSRASVTTLDNGLQVIMLEEHSLPVVSVQMLYKVGAKNEQYGLTGISHYLEHMAFRATENFPDTDVVSKIYAVGGEWHAYTWIDQTVYYETLPSTQLALALRIEADRMQRLLIPEDEVDPERGAVFAEMHSYENDPANPLRDAIIATSILAHPYRNNVVGNESDINNIQQADLVDLYERHYHPGNAVLAIVGDFDAPAALKDVKKLFGDFATSKEVPLPATVEPRQQGERRVNLVAASEQQNFEIAYQAPGVKDDDFVAFLMLREILGGSEGLNFQHDLGLASVQEGTYLEEGMTTWFHPTRQPFLFTISGTVPAETSQAETEKSVEQQLARLREVPVSVAMLQYAKQQLLKALVFDVETTEDAAHQLGFFAGLDALDVLLGLQHSITKVEATDIQRVARHYLAATQRTTGWSTPTAAARLALAAKPGEKLTRPPVRMQKTTRQSAVKDRASGVHYLSAGMPVIAKPMRLSNSAYLAIVYPTTRIDLGENAAANVAVHGHTMQEFRVLPNELAGAIRTARHSLSEAGLVDAETPIASNDPWSRLSQAVEQVSAYDEAWPEDVPTPALIVAVGDFDVKLVLAQLETAFGDIAPTASMIEPPLVLRQEELAVATVLPRSQGQIAYVVPAPAPASDDYDAWRIAHYIYTHASEGRLGKKTITESGLLYWINSDYATDGQRGWIVARAGVDQHKQASVRKLFRSELARLKSEPPTAAEIADARQYFLGRQQSAAQSNTEIAHRLVRDWMSRGEIVTMKSLRTRLDAVSREDVIRILPAYTAGSIVTVDVSGQLPATAGD